MGTRDADKIREYAYEHYIKPAKEKGEASVSFKAKDIHQGMGFIEHNYPNIIGALCRKAMITRYGVKKIRREPPSDAPDVLIVYEL